MLQYVIRRLVQLLGIAIVISVGSFYLIHLLPGNPAVVILGNAYNATTKAALYKQLGLNKPIIEQYFIWMSHVLRGNLGTSFISRVSVVSTIKGALGIDVELIILSQFLALLFAIPMAMRSARKPDGPIDRLLSAGSFTLLSMPPYIIIVLLVLLVAIKLNLANTGPSAYVALGTDWIGNLESMSLAAITVALGSFTLYFRVLRSDLIATMQEEFITMARSKGLSRRRIMWRHAFRPSSVTLLGTFSVNVGGLLAALFVVENLLALPGLGYILISAINTSDYLLVQGIVLVVSVGVVVINFVFDFIINLVDPRISRE